MNLSQLSASFSLKNRFNREVAWNLASFVVLAICGLLVNAVIARAYGPAALGIFNQVFAYYILLSQIAVLGVHFSVLKYVSYSQNDLPRCGQIATAALLTALVLSVAVAGITYLLRELPAAWQGSPGVGVGLALACPGLVLFSVNKVLLNVLNGLRHMRAYAVLQALRFVLILAAIVLLAALGRPPEQLALALTIAEGLVCLVSLGYVYGGVLPFSLSGRLRFWVKEHFYFGLRGFLSGALSEINTRVDVLILGLLCTDEVVGIYSFAALLAEGFSQIAMVLRRNVDPILGKAFAMGETGKIPGYAARIRRGAYLLMLAVTVVSVGLYPLVLRVLAPDRSFTASWLVFAILMSGILFNAGYRPFLGILLQGGRPGTHTLLVVALVTSNVILNAALIPLLGMYGAALATALVYVLEAVLIIALARRILGVRL